MKIEVLNESRQNNVCLAVREADERFLNALRRAVNSEIPAFAIDEVSFYENTSPLFNEYVANRLALIPLTFEEGTAQDAQIAFHLDAEAAEGPRTVYSSELQSSDPVIRVFCERIPILKLGKGQKLKLEATAVQGRGRQHAKFQSALASYGALPDFRVSSKCDKCGACVNACPKKIISPQIKLSAPEKCLLCENCVESCPKNAVTVRPKEGEFVFFVESFNNLSAREQLGRALGLIGEKLVFIEKAIKNPKFLEKLAEEEEAAQARKLGEKEKEKAEAGEAAGEAAVKEEKAAKAEKKERREKKGKQSRKEKEGKEKESGE
jgi:DNA-directed RNA polymerase subunit D